MALDKLRTASGKRLRGEALQETALPIPYDAAVLPGAAVLGTDGQLYQSAKNTAGDYEWGSALLLTSNGVAIRAPDVVPTFKGLILGGQITATGQETGPARILLAPFRDPTPSLSGAIMARIDFGSRDEVALSDREIATPASISVAANKDLWGADSKPVSLRISLADRDTLDRTNRFQLEFDGSILFLNALQQNIARFSTAGNLLLGNTTGTERLSVTGNIQVTETTDGFLVGANQVLGSRRTGWAAPTGTATRTTFVTSTVTTEQLAERVKALIDDLTTHGLIGT